MPVRQVSFSYLVYQAPARKSGQLVFRARARGTHFRLHRVLGNELVNMHRFRLTNSMSTILRLYIHLRILEANEQPGNIEYHLDLPNLDRRK